MINELTKSIAYQGKMRMATRQHSTMVKRREEWCHPLGWSNFWYFHCSGEADRKQACLSYTMVRSVPCRKIPAPLSVHHPFFRASPSFQEPRLHAAPGEGLSKALSASSSAGPTAGCRALGEGEAGLLSIKRKDTHSW